MCSGRVTRECGVQIPLIDLLCDYRADPDGAVQSAAWARRVRRAGRASSAAERGSIWRPPPRPVASTRCGRSSNQPMGRSRHCALALAAQHGHARDRPVSSSTPVRIPAGTTRSACHSHSTPLHQAALAGHADVVRLLVERGARVDTKDILHDGTPLEWAEYAGHLSRTILAGSWRLGVEGSATLESPAYERLPVNRQRCCTNVYPERRRVSSSRVGSSVHADGSCASFLRRKLCFNRWASRTSRYRDIDGYRTSVN